MFQYIKISTLNDFIFCPKSIYFHDLYAKYNSQIFQQTVQIAGKFAHKNIDNQKYSSSKDVLQGLSVFSEKYGLIGKIDLFYKDEGLLVERKNRVVKIYDGYKYQLYAQYFCMIEMGYKVKKLKIYSLKYNKSYNINLPQIEDITEFEALLREYKNFDPNMSDFKTNEIKCKKCIYNELCDLYI